jgi:hypothetical protein
MVLLLGSQLALGDNWNPAMPPPGASMGPAQPPNPYAAAWPPPSTSTGQPPQFNASPGPAAGQPAPNAPAFDVGRTSWIAPAGSPAPPVVAAAAASSDNSHESSWYYRLDTFHWNERSNGADFVNEYGPISTVGYVHRSGVERYRFELFGGTVAYDGALLSWDGQPSEPYHQSFGTNYLGGRTEYDLLVEPTAWSKARLVLGVGTRFWMRDLLGSYQEFWWTLYPYVGLETKDSNEPGPQFFGSVRAGITPLTFQFCPDFFGEASVVYPRCGVTGQMELGVRFQKFSASAFLEAFTWGQSADVDGSNQPASRMLTIGGKLGYTF